MEVGLADAVGVNKPGHHQQTVQDSVFTSVCDGAASAAVWSSHQALSVPVPAPDSQRGWASVDGGVQMVAVRVCKFWLKSPPLAAESDARAPSTSTCDEARPKGARAGRVLACWAGEMAVIPRNRQSNDPLACPRRVSGTNALPPWATSDLEKGVHGC